MATTTSKLATPAAKEKLSGKSLCTVFLSFKSLLIFIYELVHSLISKLSGNKGMSQSIAIKTKNSNKSVKIGQDGNGNIPQCKDKKRVKDIWEIPGPRPLPFFGTLLNGAGLNDHDLTEVNEEREKLYGPVVKEEHFWNYPIVMILGTEEIKQIIKLNPVMRPAMPIVTFYRTLKPDRYKSFGLVSSQGATWKNLHHIFSMVSSNMGFVRSLLPGVDGIANDVVDFLAQEKGPTTVLPLAISKLISEASFYTVFGKRMGFAGTGCADAETLKLFSHCHDVYWTALHKSMYEFPWWKYVTTKVWKDFTSCEDTLIEMISDMTDNMLAELDDSSVGMLASVPRHQLLKQDLQVVLLELITGATEPVYHTTMITLYWICKYEHVYNKILEELREQMPTKDYPVDEAVLDNVPYLKACMQEAFRICPAACNVARILEEEVQVNDYKLPPYTVVILQTMHACLKDSNFYRAKEYLPERWLLEDGVPPFKPHDRAVMNNFGIGTRQCLGRRIALQLITTFLCRMLRKYRVKFIGDIKLRYEWLMVVKEPILIELHENDF